jgi:hypothetical protein
VNKEQGGKVSLAARHLRRARAISCWLYIRICR